MLPSFRDLLYHRYPTGPAIDDMAGPTPADRKLHLLALAPEIRNQVYRYIFCSDNLYLHADVRPFGRSSLPLHNLLNILLTCRQCHNEARPILFEEACFQVETGSSFHGTGQAYVPTQVQQLYRHARFIQIPAIGYNTVNDFCVSQS